jgi:hypothetical protein
MKRRVEQREQGTRDERFAQAALAGLREAAAAEHPKPPRRSSEAASLMRLAAETRELLALWTYYRLACLEAMDSGPLGAA